jgi:hypothetical protein
MKTPMSVKNRIKQELGQIYGENTLSRAASNTSNRSSKPTNLDKQFVNVATVTPARTEPATSLSPQTLSLEAMNRPNILQNVLKKLYKTKEGQEKVRLGFFIFHEKDCIFHTQAPFSINQQLTGGALATIGIDTL